MTSVVDVDPSGIVRFEVHTAVSDRLELELRVELWDADPPPIPEPAKKAYAATATTMRSTMARTIAIAAIPLPS